MTLPTPSSPHCKKKSLKSSKPLAKEDVYPVHPTLHRAILHQVYIGRFVSSMTPSFSHNNVSLLGHISKLVSILLSKLSHCPNTDTSLSYCNHPFLTVYTSINNKAVVSYISQELISRLGQARPVYMCMAESAPDIVFWIFMNLFAPDSISLSSCPGSQSQLMLLSQPGREAQVCRIVIVALSLDTPVPHFLHKLINSSAHIYTC